VLILIIADQTLNDSLYCSYVFNYYKIGPGTFNHCFSDWLIIKLLDFSSECFSTANSFWLLNFCMFFFYIFVSGFLYVFNYYKIGPGTFNHCFSDWLIIQLLDFSSECFSTAHFFWLLNFCMLFFYISKIILKISSIYFRSWR